MTVQERETVRAFIETMIGKPKDWAPDTMSLVERMSRREAAYEHSRKERAGGAQHDDYKRGVQGARRDRIGPAVDARIQ